MKSAVVLVGGEAKRANGREKYFFTYRGRTFIERLIDSLTAVVDEIIIVARSPEQCARFRALPGITCISDIRRGIGPVGGLHAASLAARGDLIFVSAGDMPCIDPRVVTYLFEAVGSCDAAIPRWDGQMVEPLHAVYRRSALLACLEQHTPLSLKDMIQSLNARYIPVDDLRAMDPDLRTFTNINRLEELERINRSPGNEE